MPSSGEDPYVEAISPVRDTQADPLTPDTIICDVLMPTDMIRRLRRMLDYAHPSNAEFSLSKIPPDVLWDTRVNPGVLFANGQILKIRVIATVATVQEAGNVINFDMVLFRDIDREGYQRLRRRSKPKPRTYETVMRIQYHGGLPSEVYDATHRIRPPNALVRLPLTAVCEGDTVRVDCIAVQRGDRERWTVGFELTSIYKLWSSRRDVVQDI